MPVVARGHRDGSHLAHGVVECQWPVDEASSDLAAIGHLALQAPVQAVLARRVLADLDRMGLIVQAVHAALRRTPLLRAGNAVCGDANGNQREQDDPTTRN